MKRLQLLFSWQNLFYDSKSLSHIQQSYKNMLVVRKLHDIMLTNISMLKYFEYKFDGTGLFSI